MMPGWPATAPRLPSRKPPKRQDKAARWKVIALTMAAALVLTLSFAAHQANEVARLQLEARGMSQTEIVTPQNQNTGGATMTVLEWLQELEEEERIIKVGCVDNTLRGLRRCTARMAAASYLHWACPEYLAPQLGLAFECKSPRSTTKHTASAARRRFCPRRCRTQGR